jgi:hypothetical protein
MAMVGMRVISNFLGRIVSWLERLSNLSSRGMGILPMAAVLRSSLRSGEKQERSVIQIQRRSLRSFLIGVRRCS